MGQFIQVGTSNAADSTGTITLLQGLSIVALKTASSTITTSALLDIGANVGTTQYAIRSAANSGSVLLRGTAAAATPSATEVTFGAGEGRFGAGVTCTTIAASQSIRSTSPTLGIGYGTGAGGAVAQATSKATGATLNTVCGTIALNAAALAAATSVAFVLTNSAIAATDVVTIVHDSVGTLGGYGFAVTPAAGSATITVRNNTAGSLSEAIVLRFFINKAVVS
jgi:hypothetical protein